MLPARRRIATDEQLLPTGPSEPLAMSASTIGIDNLHEVFSLGRTAVSPSHRMCDGSRWSRWADFRLPRCAPFPATSTSCSRR